MNEEKKTFSLMKVEVCESRQHVFLCFSVFVRGWFLINTHKVLKSVVKEPKRPQYADFNLLIIQNVDRRVFTAHRLVDFCIH